MCGPAGTEVRTDQDKLREMMEEIGCKVTENPLLLNLNFSYTPLTFPKSPENPGHAAIRRMNWERRVKRLKKDWYGERT